MYILGISAFYHDSAVTFICDGQIVYAAQEERFSRIKHDSNFPELAIQNGLKTLKISANQIDKIVFFEKPFLKFERIIETTVAFSPWGYFQFIKSIPLWIKEKLFQKNIIFKKLIILGFSTDIKNKLFFSNHHLSHAASAFYPSPYDEALVLTMDGVGEWATTTVYHGHENQLDLKKEIHYPHSLGLLYSAFSYYCGFKVNSGEYKLMGLAPYGRPIFADRIRASLIDIKTDGSYRLNMKYFGFATGLEMTNKKFDELFDFSFRLPDQDLKQIHMDLAASIQSVLEEIILKICIHLKSEYQIENLCLAGGVALNCVANRALLKSGLFKNIWVQPAAGDAGGSLGAALACYYLNDNNNRKNYGSDQMSGSYLGNEFTDSEIENQLIECGAVFEKKPTEQIICDTAKSLAENKAIGWFQGRMEFGPRSLGNRSILASPMSAEMQKNLNLKIKFRESFRPFAPAILAEDQSQWFDVSTSSSYMLFTSGLKSLYQISVTADEQKLFGIDLLNVRRSVVPAITHVDFSARIQTVSASTNPLFHLLISEFKKRTGVPILVNTSFNVRGEPVVCSPRDAFLCFMGTGLDILVIGSYCLIKENQDQKLITDYTNKYSKD